MEGRSQSCLFLADETTPSDRDRHTLPPQKHPASPLGIRLQRGGWQLPVSWDSAEAYRGKRQGPQQPASPLGIQIQLPDCLAAFRFTGEGDSPPKHPASPLGIQIQRGGRQLGVVGVICALTRCQHECRAGAQRRGSEHDECLQGGRRGLDQYTACRCACSLSSGPASHPDAPHPALHPSTDGGANLTCCPISRK